jgi:hypothetical protein
MRIKPIAASAGKPAKVGSIETWLDQEVKGCHFNDVGLVKRFRKLLGQMADGIVKACRQPVEIGPTPRRLIVFRQCRGGQHQIMAGHFQATQERLKQARQKFLMLHDTCEFSFQREKDSKIGLLSRPSCGRDKDGRLHHLTVRGIFSLIMQTVEVRSAILIYGNG